jgi:hypothetical protein
MLWNLDGFWLMMAIASVAVFSFFFCAALDALTREDGFGSTGNTLIVCGGFFLAIVGANYQGYNLSELHFAVLVGIAGAFVCFSLLTVMKAVITRL